MKRSERDELLKMKAEDRRSYLNVFWKITKLQWERVDNARDIEFAGPTFFVTLVDKLEKLSDQLLAVEKHMDKSV